MQICKLIDGRPTDIGPIPESIPGVSNPMLCDMVARGWLIHAPSDTQNIKASHWEAQGHVCVQVVDAVWSELELAAQATKVAEDEAAREAEAIAQDLQSNGERWVAENEYILLCDAIAGTPGAHTRLGLGDLQTALVGLITVAPARQNAIFQYLMGLQIGLQRLGGVNWWDNCTWHDHPAIVTAAGDRHGAIMAVLP
jgi:hypothetical protein